MTGEATTPRSYIVQRMSGGAPLRRNRVHLRSTRESFGKPLPDEEEDEVDVTSTVRPADEPGISTPVTLPVSDVPMVRRGTRERRPTQFYQAGQ